MTSHDLGGRRVMLVEDEMLIAMMVELALNTEGCDVVGPFGRLDDAVAAARTETMDAALLDIDLAGERVFPVADVLTARGVPFILLSGYGRDVLPVGSKHWPLCTKPFRIADLLKLLDSVMKKTAPQPNVT